jgi:hypothetical protein
VAGNILLLFFVFFLFFLFFKKIIKYYQPHQLIVELLWEMSVGIISLIDWTASFEPIWLMWPSIKSKCFFWSNGSILLFLYWLNKQHPEMPWIPNSTACLLSEDSDSCNYNKIRKNVRLQCRDRACGGLVKRAPSTLLENLRYGWVK